MPPRYRLIRYDGAPDIVSRIMSISLDGCVIFPSGGSITGTEIIDLTPSQLAALEDASKREAVWPANLDALRRANDVAR